MWKWGDGGVRVWGYRGVGVWKWSDREQGCGSGVIGEWGCGV